MSAEIRNPVFLAELPFDPPAVVNTGSVYTKDIAGQTELFFEDDTGNVFQITSAGNAPIQGGGTANQIAFFTAGNTISSDAGLGWDNIGRLFTVFPDADTFFAILPGQLAFQAFVPTVSQIQFALSPVQFAVQVSDIVTTKQSVIQAIPNEIIFQTLQSSVGSQTVVSLQAAGIMSITLVDGAGGSISASLNASSGVALSTNKTASMDFADLTVLTTVGDMVLDAASGVLRPSGDNTLDLGVVSVSRFRTGYFGTSVVIGATTTYADGSINAGSGPMDVQGTDVSLTAGTTVLHLFDGVSTTFTGIGLTDFIMGFDGGITLSTSAGPFSIIGQQSGVGLVHGTLVTAQSVFVQGPDTEKGVVEILPNGVIPADAFGEKVAADGRVVLDRTVVGTVTTTSGLFLRTEQAGVLGFNTALYLMDRAEGDGAVIPPTSTVSFAIARRRESYDYVGNNFSSATDTFLSINTLGGVSFSSQGGEILILSSSSGFMRFDGSVLIPDLDNLRDLGMVGGTWRTGYFGTSLLIGAVTITTFPVALQNDITAATGSGAISLIGDEVRLQNTANTAVLAVDGATGRFFGTYFAPFNDGVPDLGFGTFRWKSLFLSDHIEISEIVADPGATANVGKLYTKDVAGVTELFFQRDDASVVQLT